MVTTETQRTLPLVYTYSQVVHTTREFPSDCSINIHCNDHYGFCIVTNIHHQLNIYVTDVSVHPDAGNTIPVSKRQLLDGNCGVDTSLIDKVPVFCALDFF